jgi:V8-like Glu-specific endopeptidase
MKIFHVKISKIIFLKNTHFIKSPYRGEPTVFRPKGEKLGGLLLFVFLFLQHFYRHNPLHML